MTPPAVTVVGGGRVGLSLGRALSRAGWAVTTCGRRERPLPPPLGASVRDLRAAVAGAELVVLCVPDDAIAEVAAAVAATGTVARGTVVLHASGLLDRGVLAPVAACGAACGSWHPLQSLADPDGDPDALCGAPAILEGDAAAVAAGRAIAAACGMAPVLEVAAAAKPAYHAAAVFAGNYPVVLLRIAERLLREAGIAADATLFVPMLQRVAANIAARGTDGALTGPAVRGDAGTMAAHRAVLDPETAALYELLAREAGRGEGET